MPASPSVTAVKNYSRDMGGNGSVLQSSSVVCGFTTVMCEYALFWLSTPQAICKIFLTATSFSFGYISHGIFLDSPSLAWLMSGDGSGSEGGADGTDATQ